ncbi:hypothetical protein HSR121_0025 [Halapricum desulfuricans]|uniref:Uncharacterized protein n=2 Tax=Halapricum desulfuricans TaxID=2841257 RepID=A0A897N234_9EURY|nr:hypothetical protein HSR121_0025 [Halapricum desulfuricans]
MNSRRRDSHADSIRHAITSRRALLTASGTIAIGALSGCLGQVASTVTNTGSSPAAVFAGMDWNDDDTEVTLTFEDELRGKPHVARLTPTLAGRVELEGWVTSSAVMAQDYNSSRSNKQQARAADEDSDSDGVDDDVRGEDYNSPRSNRSIAGPSDIIDDDMDEDDETFRRVSRLDAQLEEATTAAATAISKRSARTGRNPETEKEITESLSDMEAVLAEMRAVLERCSDESCVAALANVTDREADVVRAQEYARDGEWEAFGLDGGGDENDILVGDYLLPPVEFDSSGLFNPGEQAELFRYLEQKPVVAERFAVCLPDAEVPGGNGSIEDAVTPERLFSYLTGRSDGEGNVYAWGKNQYGSSGPDESGDCDDDDSTVSPGAVCGETPHFVAEMTGPVATGGGLVAERAADGHIVVMNSPPSAEAGTSVVVCPVEGEPFEPEGLDAWGKRAGGPPATMDAQGRIVDLTVAQVMVQPPGCPEPVPALMYVGRGRSDGQLIYSGGWIIDDAALYESSTTVLSMAGAAQVVGIECCFDYSADGDGLSDFVARAGLSERARRGARMDSGTVDELVKAGVFSADSFDPEDPMVSDFLRSRSGGGGGGRVALTHVAMDAPVLHLVNAASASDEVKFKTGAELSKSVN